MSVRPPQILNQSGSAGGRLSALEYELIAERASSLGRQGLKVEAALAKLRAWDPDRHSIADRESLLYNASDAVWALFIHRETCGLRNNRDVIQNYGIPNEVLAKVGSIRR